MFWQGFVEDGEESFNYMINNFHTMFDGNSVIKHFIISYGLYEVDKEANNLNSTIGTEIQKEIVLWIRKEYEDGRLLEKNLWKPFRDDKIIHDSYYGYRKMIQYGNYYFQLRLDKYCELTKCKYCDKEENCVNFQLALYGWMNNSCDKLQPHNRITIPSDMIMPDYYWNLK